MVKREPGMLTAHGQSGVDEYANWTTHVNTRVL
jgi:hypothetical protein